MLVSTAPLIIKILATATFEKALSHSHRRKADENNYTYTAVVT